MGKDQVTRITPWNASEMLARPTFCPPCDPPDVDQLAPQDDDDSCIPCNDKDAKEDEPRPQRGRLGKQIHVSVSSYAVTKFSDVERTSMVCFRCGERGHVRFQCLSYKVRQCWHYSSPTGCKDPFCTFAHGESELRTPWMQRCVRVVRHNGKLVSLGCLSTSHTFRRCPMNKGFVFY